MAYATQSRADGASFFDRLADFRASTSAYMARRRVYTETRRELEMLSDRDLADLGISRVQIGEIAREAAYGRT